MNARLILFLAILTTLPATAQSPKEEKPFRGVVESVNIKEKLMTLKAPSGELQIKVPEDVATLQIEGSGNVLRVTDILTKKQSLLPAREKVDQEGTLSFANTPRKPTVIINYAKDAEGKAVLKSFESFEVAPPFGPTPPPRTTPKPRVP